MLLTRRCKIWTTPTSLRNPFPTDLDFFSYAMIRTLPSPRHESCLSGLAASTLSTRQHPLLSPEPFLPPTQSSHRLSALSRAHRNPAFESVGSGGKGEQSVIHIEEEGEYLSKISRTLAGADKKDLMRKLPKFIYDEEKALEKTRKILTEKIAQLNSAIDDVSSQLRADDDPNGAAVASDEVQATS